MVTNNKITLHPSTSYYIVGMTRSIAHSNYDQEKVYVCDNMYITSKFQLANCSPLSGGIYCLVLKFAKEKVHIAT